MYVLHSGLQPSWPACTVPFSVVLTFLLSVIHMNQHGARRQEFAGIQPCGNDAILLLKERMACQRLSQRPLLLLPAALLDALPDVLKPAGRNVLSKRELQEYRKTATGLDCVAVTAPLLCNVRYGCVSAATLALPFCMSYWWPLPMMPLHLQAGGCRHTMHSPTACCLPTG